MEQPVEQIAGNLPQSGLGIPQRVRPGQKIQQCNRAGTVTAEIDRENRALDSDLAEQPGRMTSQRNSKGFSQANTRKASWSTIRN